MKKSRRTESRKWMVFQANKLSVKPVFWICIQCLLTEWNLWLEPRAYVNVCEDVRSINCSRTLIQYLGTWRRVN